MFKGIVNGKGSGPLNGAEVTLNPGGRTTRTRSDGRFALDNISAASYVVTVRAVGYKPIEADAELRGSDTLSVTFELEAVPQVLAPLKVEGEAPVVRGKMVGFEERRKVGFGRFITRAALEKREHSTLSDVLRMVAGMSLVRRPVECGDGFAPATGRSMPLKREIWMQCDGFPMKPACFMTVYLDGARIWTWGEPEIINLDNYAPNSLEGVEVYRGPAELPTQFQQTGSSCGAILLWTRQ